MNPLLAVLAGIAWVGLTLLLSQLRWFRRPGLTSRLALFAPGQQATNAGPSGLVSLGSFREVIGPLARTAGERLTRLFGVAEQLEVRLRRIDSPLDPTAFRIRQLGWAGVAGALMLVFGLLLPLPPVVVLVAVVAAPLLAFLALEQSVITASNRRRERIFTELPVVTEQLGMLLGAGFSLGAALTRLAERGTGVCKDDLRKVGNRIRQGLDVTEALREWAELADIDELHRLVNVLALNQEAGDMGRLISEEARAMRREAQRRTIELVERRSQMVWIPVTVATLVPGVMLMAVPFIGAMQSWSTL
ncbi:MAG: tight adherence protein [Acidimicrobiia bacterium]|nr:tight adherence protein [Acidimicrobiia bacterium]